MQLFLRKNQNKCRLQRTEKNSKRQLESHNDDRDENKTLKHRNVNANRACVRMYILVVLVERKREQRM